MTREDVDRLFDLLAIYRPGDRHLEDKPLRAAWALVLEPYAPEVVRGAVGAYFRRSKYWPDVTDLALLCPPPVGTEGPEAAAPERERSRWSRRSRENIDEQMEEMLALGEGMAWDYRAAGLPHPAKARGMGWSCREWLARCRAAQAEEREEENGE